jgi:hypothetical protein
MLAIISNNNSILLIEYHYTELSGRSVYDRR